jgi:hypothetical protein
VRLIGFCGGRGLLFCCDGGGVYGSFCDADPRAVRVGCAAVLLLGCSVRYLWKRKFSSGQFVPIACIISCPMTSTTGFLADTSGVDVHQGKCRGRRGCSANEERGLGRSGEHAALAHHRGCDALHLLQTPWRGP